MKSKRIVLLLLTLAFGINSCEKSHEVASSIKEGPATVIINMLGIDATGESLAAIAAAPVKLASASKINRQTTNPQEIQETIVPFDKNLSIIATLVPEGILARSEMPQASSKLKASAKSMATTVQKPLDPNVKYKVVVYDSIGNYVDVRTYNYGQAPDEPGFVLDGGSLYTFVVYSINSGTVTLPNVMNEGTLLTASIDNVSQDLMYFKKDLRLIGGNNYLDVILKHQFSQITTKIELDATTPGNITSISSTTLKPTRSSASLKLSNGNITYNSEITAGASVLFPGLGGGVRSITSSPTSIISPATTKGEFKIGSITVNGTSKGNVVLSNLNITPGGKYNLNLKIQSPCTVDVNDVDGVFDFNIPGGAPPSKTILTPDADNGFVLDLTYLNNSFNMTINGTPLISNAAGLNHEVQFQAGDTSYPRNIQFADGTVWGTVFPFISDIAAMAGTIYTSPIIRLVITPSGDVFMYGSKLPFGGNLQSLSLNNGYFFNKITWNTTGTNVVVLSQIVRGVTVMAGKGVGKRTIPCPLVL